jgi:hypothetical protein
VAVSGEGWPGPVQVTLWGGSALVQRLVRDLVAEYVAQESGSAWLGRWVSFCVGPLVRLLGVTVDVRLQDSPSVAVAPPWWGRGPLLLAWRLGPLRQLPLRAEGERLICGESTPERLAPPEQAGEPVLRVRAARERVLALPEEPVARVLAQARQGELALTCEGERSAELRLQVQLAQETDAALLLEVIERWRASHEPDLRQALERSGCAYRLGWEGSGSQVSGELLALTEEGWAEAARQLAALAPVETD